MLRPAPHENATQRLMSAVYGTGVVPFHIDSANSRVPPHLTFVCLATGNASKWPTPLHDSVALPLRADEQVQLHQDVWYVDGGRERFLTSILSRPGFSQNGIVRFDPSCMKPGHPKFKRSADLLERACRGVSPIRVDWEAGVRIILDNWRVLHARGLPPQANENRVLERVMIAT